MHRSRIVSTLRTLHCVVAVLRLRLRCGTTVISSRRAQRNSFYLHLGVIDLLRTCTIRNIKIKGNTYHCMTSVNERALGCLIAQTNRRKIPCQNGKGRKQNFNFFSLLQPCIGDFHFAGLGALYRRILLHVVLQSSNVQTNALLLRY